jgi:hypothetical protein
VCELQAINETDGRPIRARPLLTGSPGEVTSSDHHRLRASADASAKLRHDVRPDATRYSFRLHREPDGRQPGQIQCSCDVDATVSEEACAGRTNHDRVLASEDL